MAMDALFALRSKSDGVSASASPLRTPSQYRTSKIMKDVSLSMMARENSLYLSLVQKRISSVFLLPMRSTLLMELDGRL